MTRHHHHVVVRHPAAAYVLLTFAWSYGVGLPVQMALAAWAPGLPDLAAHYLGRAAVVAGPALAALWVTRAVEGRAGVRTLLARLRPDPLHAWWWVALPALSLMLTLAAYILGGTAADALGMALAAGWPLLLVHYGLQVLAVGIGEELGWRGWLLPRLLRRRSPGAATALVALVWGLWHLPILLSGAGMALSFSLAVLALSVLFTLLWHRTGGSVFCVAVAHGSVNAPLFFLEGALESEAAGGAWYAVCALYALLAALLSMATWRWWRERPAERTPEPV